MGALGFGEHMRIGHVGMPDIQGIISKLGPNRKFLESYIFLSPTEVYPLFMYREEVEKKARQKKILTTTTENERQTLIHQQSKNKNAPGR